MIRLLVISILFSSFINGSAQDFRDPIEIPLSLSGTFGEIRYNHFHSGIDIRTNGKTGYPIYAVEEGFISRVRISPYGYGLAIYIDHPDRLTSVYGHLERFNDTITTYVKALQYELESSEIDIYPDRDLFPVRKGDIIGYSGNSGGSGGPHLHFELRETKSEIPINPLAYSFSVNDAIQPTINKLFIYQGYSMSTKRISLSANNLGSGKYIIPDTIEVSAGRIGVGVLTGDRQANSSLNGIYKLVLLVDDSTYFEIVLDKISFDETRYVNAMIDYQERLSSRSKIMKAFRHPGNFLNVYPTHGDGYLKIQPGEFKHASLVISDYSGNESNIKFTMKGGKKNHPKSMMSESIFLPGTTNKYEDDKIRIEIPKFALYDTINFQYLNKELNHSSHYSGEHTIHSPYVPVHYHMDISMKIEKEFAGLEDKLLIIRKDHRGRKISEGGIYHDGWILATSRVFGTFYIGLDTTKPQIKMLTSTNKSIASNGTVKMMISDNLSGIKSYKAEIDKQWVLSYFDAKRDVLYCKLDHKISGGEHKMTITVSDEKNNVTTLTKNITIR